MGYGHLNIDEREMILKMRAQQTTASHQRSAWPQQGYEQL